MSDSLQELQDLDAIAAEQGSVLAFRVCQDDEDSFEAVYMKVLTANRGGERESAVIAIEDRNGMSLGCYLVPRSKLDVALAEAADLDGHDDESAPESLQT